MNSDIVDIKPKKSKLDSKKNREEYNFTTNHVEKNNSIDNEKDYLNINNEIKNKAKNDKNTSNRISG